jgi:hypothetical protein
MRVYSQVISDGVCVWWYSVCVVTAVVVAVALLAAIEVAIGATGIIIVSGGEGDSNWCANTPNFTLTVYNQ